LLVAHFCVFLLVHLLVCRTCEADSGIAGRVCSSAEQRKAVIIRRLVWQCPGSVGWTGIVKRKCFCLLCQKETN